MDVARWLQGLGLERYASAFRANEIDWEALPRLSAEDLKDLGVVLRNHRRRLLDAIAGLGSPLLPAASLTAAWRDPPGLPEAEHRPRTVMFCDLVARLCLPHAWIPRICARSSAYITAPWPKSSRDSMASSQNTWAMAF
jgi:hypothetical protein